MIKEKLYKRSNGYKPVPFDENVNILKEEASKGSSFKMNKLIKSWSYLNSDKQTAFVEALNILSDYTKHCDNDVKIYGVISSFCENVIPSIPDLKKAKLTLQLFADTNIYGYDILKECNNQINANRVLRNHEKLNTYINIDDVIENTYTSECMLDECVFEICSKINNLKMKNSIKYNSCLENILYGFEKKECKFDRAELLESITNFFILNNDDSDQIKTILKETQFYTEDDKLKTGNFYVPTLINENVNDELQDLIEKINKFCSKSLSKLKGATIDKFVDSLDEILNAIRYHYILNKKKVKKDVAFYLVAKSIQICLKNADKQYINKIRKQCEKEKHIVSKQIKTEQDQDVKDFLLEYYDILDINIKKLKSDSSILKYVYKSDTNLLKNAIKDYSEYNSTLENANIKSNLTEIIAESLKNINVDKTINKLDKDTPPRIKSFLEKIYSKSPEQIVDELPNILIYIRKILVLGTVAINPVIGILSLLVDSFIAMTIKRETAEKMLKQLNAEKRNIERQYNASKNEKTKEKYKKYMDKLDKSINKISTYEDSLYTDAENDDRMFSKLEESTSFDDKINYILNDKKDYLTQYEYFDDAHHLLVLSELNKTIIKYIDLIKSKYSKLAVQKVLIPTSENNILYFDHINIDRLYKFLDNNGKISVEIGCCLPLNLIKDRTRPLTEEENKKLLNNLSDITNTLNKGLSDNFYVTFEGTSDFYRLYLVYDITVKEVKESTEGFHTCIENDIAMILEMGDNVDRLNNIDKVLESVGDNILNYDEDVLSNIVKFTNNTEDVFDKNVLVESFKDAISKVTKTLLGAERYKKLSSLNENVYDLSSKMFKIKNEKNKPKTHYEIISETNEICNILDSLEEINKCNDNKNIMQEVSFINTLKMTKEKLANSTKNLSDKEKMLSRQLDTSIDNFSSKVQQTVSNNNREAVIKGSLIPSASKVIKMAVMTGIAYAVNPALAVIGVLGGLATSKMLKHKEKQMILDEIDIELKLVEKKIQLAEGNSDMKSLEKLFKIEKRLKRERQRIMYNLKVYYSTNNSKDNED